MALALLAPLLLAAACLSVLVIDDIRLSGQPAAAITPNQLVMMCVSLRLTGNWRAATWWSAAVSARTGRLRRPYIQSNIACGLVPWQSWLPSSGTIQTSN